MGTGGAYGGSCPQPELVPSPVATAAHTSAHTGQGEAVAVGEAAAEGDTDVDAAAEGDTDVDAAAEGDTDVEAATEAESDGEG